MEYKPSKDETLDILSCTYLTMKNGNGFYIYLTTDEFEELLNNHQK